MLHSWCDDTVKVTRAPWMETRGTKVRDWANATTHTVGGCSVQPASTSRNFERAQQETDRWTLYAPPQSDIQAGDRINHHGATFEVDGAPYTWKSPTGRVTHMQAPLVEWRG